jgi:hypothetical protein
MKGLALACRKMALNRMGRMNRARICGSTVLCDFELI